MIQWLVLKVTQWLLCDKMSSKLSLFLRHSEIAYQTEQLFVKESMISLESYEMNAFPFYETFSKSIPNWAICLKQVFDLMIILERDKMTSLLQSPLNFHFLSVLIP